MSAADILRELVEVHRKIEAHLSRLADHFDPPPPDIVGTPYVAHKLGCTTDWIAMLVRDSEIPVSCLIPGTGNGKPWKFRRSRIDEWIKNR
jgi:predicted DNA-binding transcriptional regulator AlpA